MGIKKAYLLMAGKKFACVCSVMLLFLMDGKCVSSFKVSGCKKHRHLHDMTNYCLGDGHFKCHNLYTCHVPSTIKNNGTYQKAK